MSELSLLEGRLRHCVRKARGKDGKMHCSSFKPGPGRLRGKNLVNYKRSTTKKRPIRVKVCRKLKGHSRKTCTWRYVTAAQARKRGYRKIGRGTVVRAKKGKVRKASSRGKRTTRRTASWYNRKATSTARKIASLEKKLQKQRAMVVKKAGGLGDLSGRRGAKRRRSR